MVAMFLLAGIILSNAYKNTNVYNMVIPRKTILYKEFAELVYGGFTLYTRSHLIRVVSRSFGVDTSPKYIGEYFEHMGNYTYVLRSEVKVRSFKLIFIYDLMQGKINSDKTLVHRNRSNKGCQDTS